MVYSSYFVFCYEYEASPSMADWSQLPTELLQLISQKLNSDFYLLRFRSVCSTWRSSIPNHPPNHHLPFKLPPLPDNNDNDSVCYVVKHNIFLIKPTTITIPNQQQQQQIFIKPLLIRIGPNLNGNKIHLWHPLDLDQRLPFNFTSKVVFDFNHISIVDLGYVFLLYILKDSDSLQNYPYPYVYYENVVAATCPGELQPLIVTFNRYYEMCMFRPWDNVWTKIPNVSACEDICNFKGRTCLVDKTGRTVMVGPDLSVDFVADEISDPGMVRLCLVESELYLVVSCYGGVNVRIDVYRLDEKKKKWVKLSNLGDRVLFLGNRCSFSASASDLGFANGNCVITMSDVTLKFGMSVLNFDEGRVLPLSDYPDYFKLLAKSGLDHGQLHWED
ncbi:unnamed protein product [Trifolium pratense]|uniref:Uncharacterized protein n=1 Tax=Trifolium pratense TaxID=57577 RepID=A0ACB0J4U3_TRIPR|nr:unnamed protein product [Trifolium pratense]